MIKSNIAYNISVLFLLRYQKLKINKIVIFVRKRYKNLSARLSYQEFLTKFLNGIFLNFSSITTPTESASSEPYSGGSLILRFPESFAATPFFQRFDDQKQPPEVFYEKRCSWKFRKIHRKTPVPESLF